MKKDINPPKVEDIAVAVVEEENNLKQKEWNAYLINMKNTTIEGVLVSSKGYGQLDGEMKKTAMLRHFLDEMKPRTYKKIEGLTQDLFAISNEFWVSFYLDKKMFDKKYIFLAESIKEDNFINVPIIEKRGVLIM